MTTINEALARIYDDLITKSWDRSITHGAYQDAWKTVEREFDVDPNFDWTKGQRPRSSLQADRDRLAAENEKLRAALWAMLSHYAPDSDDDTDEAVMTRAALDAGGGGVMAEEQRKRYYRLWMDVRPGLRWWLTDDGESYTDDRAEAAIFTSDDDHWSDWVFLHKEYLSMDEHMKRWGVASFPWLEDAQP